MRVVDVQPFIYSFNLSLNIKLDEFSNIGMFQKEKEYSNWTKLVSPLLESRYPVYKGKRK